MPLAFLDVEQFTHPLLAATWQDCIHGRGRCQMSSTGQISTKPLLPKRVLDLGDSTSTELTTSVRLHESVAGERSDYVALSHRWGENIPSKTTTINLDMYKRGVIYSDLPCTFKDAIDTSRNMGIRYVWIDALCIVQDDHDDWASQAPLMGTIFQNATCTIAAHSAEHSDYGFLSIAKGTKMVEVGSEYQQSQSQSAVDKIYLELPRNFDGFISRSHITQRGWVQQELILSRRLMHFFNGLVFWECDHLASPEPLGFTAELHTFRDLQTYRKRTLRTLENNPGGSWLDFVTHYSACELTYPSDRLVAIDGIAREWMDRMGTTVAQHYRYGHFLHNASSLLWVAENVVISKRRHVPSWSWASMEGSVQFMRSQPIGLISHLQSMSFQVNASIKYAQTSRPDRKDQVVISTQVTALDVSCPKNTQRHSHYWHNIWDQGNPKGYPLHLPHDATCFFDHPPDNIRAGKTNAKNNYRNEFELYFAKIATFEPLWHDGDTIAPGYGVLLLQRRRPGSSIFRRVGVGFIVGSSTFGPSWFNEEKAIKTLIIE